MIAFLFLAPVAIVALHLALGQHNAQRAREEWEAILEEASPVAVEVLAQSVRFDAVGLTSEEIVALQVGDIVPLNHPIDRPLRVTVDDVLCCDGVSGRRGKRLATLIVDVNRDAGWR